MKRAANTKSRYVKSALAAVVTATLSLPMLNAASAATSFNMIAMDAELSAMLLDINTFPPTPPAGPFNELVAGAAIDSVLATIDNTGNAPASPVAYGPDDRLSTSLLWVKAKLAKDTLMKRCEYWRDNVNDQTTATNPAARPNLTEAYRRATEMQNGALLIAAPQTAGRVNLTNVAALQDDVDDLLNQLQGIPGMPDLSDPDARFSTNVFYTVLDNFHSIVSSACPAP